MTLPAVINDKQNKELETALKKAYSNLAQATQMMAIEDFAENINTINSVQLIPYYAKYYKNFKKCTGYNSENGCPNTNNSNFCNFMLENYKTYNGKNPRLCIGNDGLANTIDNTSIFFDSAGATDPNYGSLLVVIDVNGWQKKPNKYGHDTFLFQINEEGKVLPMGANGTIWSDEKYCSKTSNDMANGYGCTAKALSSGNYFTNLPN